MDRIDARAARPPLAPESWTIQRVVVAGYLLVAFLAGLMFIAPFFDSLT